MNFIKEINAFYDWCEIHPISAGSMSLWYALMHINNKIYWVKEFHVPMNVLMLRTGLSKKQFSIAREKLISTGRITMCQKASYQTATYTINPFFDRDGNPIIEGKTADSDMVCTNEFPVDEVPDEVSNKQENGEKMMIIKSDMVPNQSKKVLQTDTYIKTKQTKLNKTKQNNIEEDKSSSSAGDVQKFNLISFFDEYNELCTRLPKAKIFSKRRAQEVGARYREHGEEAVHNVIRLAAESDFLCGNSKSGWQANFDWIFLPTNFVKILEGYYGNKLPNLEFADSPGQNNHRNRYADEYIGKPSPMELLEQSYKDMFGDENFDY
jgi:hypothetical protein